MDVKKLFSGIAVIIDNDIYKTDTPIYKMKQCLINNHIPVSCFEELPPKEMIPAFSNASFIIIDWDLWNDFGLPGVDIGDGLKENNRQELLEFIRKILAALFVPVFIFSGLSVESIQETLIANGLYDEKRANRIFLKSKDEVGTEDELFGNIESWLKEMPSAYVLKMLEKELKETQNKMFVEWYQYSPEWVKVIWNLLKKDSNSKDVKQEFAEFLFRNLVNRADAPEFESTIFQMAGLPDRDTLQKVLEYERFIRYEAQPKQAYAGDLFLEDGIYYLNVRAQCDLSRRGNNVELYLIRGEEFHAKDIQARDIRITDEGELWLLGKAISLEELGKLCNNAREEDSDAIHRLVKINEYFREYKNKVFFNNGEILEKKQEAFLACVDSGKILKFDFKKFSVKTFGNMKKNRIGRVLPPYITKIQQKFSQYIVREGVMPLPVELFTVLDPENV